MSGGAMLNSILIQKEAKLRKAKDDAKRQRDQDLKRLEQTDSIGLCSRQIKGDATAFGVTIPLISRCSLIDWQNTWIRFGINWIKCQK